MTNLTKLSVSLTKHGSHKIANLLDLSDPNTILSQTVGVFPGINIDAAQARKILSASTDHGVPAVWHEAKNSGRATINGLIMLAIIFSHVQLIKLFTRTTINFGRGKISRSDLSTQKAYSNLKNDFEELGYLTTGNATNFYFDFREILTDRTIGRLAAALFRLKLIDASWDQSGNLADECVDQGFPDALGMSIEQFRQWLSGSDVNRDDLPDKPDPDSSTSSKFSFRAGHSKRKIGNVPVRVKIKPVNAELLHNDLSDKLYQFLCDKYGKENVGSEVPTGPSGTIIDLARKNGAEFIFYEIKTSKSLRKCLREAIPQLLEYAYWVKEDRANELIIVTPNKPTQDARIYLEHLRRKFGIPIFHETIDTMNGQLSGRI